MQKQNFKEFFCSSLLLRKGKCDLKKSERNHK